MAAWEVGESVVVEWERMWPGGVAGGRWSCQRLVVAERVPRRRGVPWRVMETESAVKVAMQPWSQSLPMEMREPDARVGNRWA